jgi:hypothetical protein
MLPWCGRLRENGYVCGKWPPFQDLSRDLFLRGGFYPHPKSAGSMDQCDRATRHSHEVLACTNPPPALRAVVR